MEHAKFEAAEADPSAELSAVLERVAGECKDMAGAMDEVQDLLGDMMESGGLKLGPEAIRTLQDLDRLTQILICLSSLMTSISGATTGISVPRSELAAQLRLDSLVDRLLHHG